MAEPTPIFAAVCCSDGAMIDRLFRDLVTALQRQSHPVCGVLQHRENADGECRADMSLELISTGETIDISQTLGPGSRGCRLNPGAICDITVRLTKDLDRAPELLVLNRFGKGEFDGQGFRQLIVTALDLDIPVLLAVRPPYLDSWREFAGGLGVELPPDLAGIQSWCTSVLPPPNH